MTAGKYLLLCLRLDYHKGWSAGTVNCSLSIPANRRRKQKQLKKEFPCIIKLKKIQALGSSVTLSTPRVGYRMGD